MRRWLAIAGAFLAGLAVLALFLVFIAILRGAR